MPGLFRFRSWLPYSMDVFMYGERQGLWTTLIVKERFVFGKVRPCLQKDEKFDSSHCSTTEIASPSSVLGASQWQPARDHLRGLAHWGKQAGSKKGPLVVGLSDDSPGIQARPGPWCLAYLLVPLGLLPLPAVCS